VKHGLRRDIASELGRRRVPFLIYSGYGETAGSPPEALIVPTQVPFGHEINCELAAYQ
jgi:hypothetical protein